MPPKRVGKVNVSQEEKKAVLQAVGRVGRMPKDVCSYLMEHKLLNEKSAHFTYFSKAGKEGGPQLSTVQKRITGIMNQFEGRPARASKGKEGTHMQNALRDFENTVEKPPKKKPCKRKQNKPEDKESLPQDPQVIQQPQDQPYDNEETKEPDAVLLAKPGTSAEEVQDTMKQKGKEEIARLAERSPPRKSRKSVIDDVATTVRANAKLDSKIKLRWAVSHGLMTEEEAEEERRNQEIA